MMDSLLANMYKKCKFYNTRDAFDSFVLKIFFDEETKVETKILQPILYLLLRRDEEARDIMEDIDFDLSKEFFDDCGPLEEPIFTLGFIPKWISIIRPSEGQLLFEKFLDIVSRDGIKKCNTINATETFVKLLYEYNNILKMFNKNISNRTYEESAWKRVIFYIMEEYGIKNMLLYYDKPRTSQIHTEISLRCVTLLREINIVRLMASEGRFIYDLYRAGYVNSNVDWENMTNKNDGYESGFNKTGLTSNTRFYI